jgi:hypothetical protein
MEADGVVMEVLLLALSYPKPIEPEAELVPVRRLIPS